MTITETDYANVVEKANEFGCKFSTGLMLVPYNFSTATSDTDLLMGAEASTIRKLLRQNSIQADYLLPSDIKVASIHNKHAEWAPLLFTTAGLLSSDPNTVSVALGIISNYATDFLKGFKSKKFKLHIIVERRKDHTCKMLTFEGDAEGLKDLKTAIEKIAND